MDDYWNKGDVMEEEKEEEKKEEEEKGEEAMEDNNGEEKRGRKRSVKDRLGARPLKLDRQAEFFGPV